MNRPITEWRGRRIWIFGASSGIGAALTRALLAEGAKVAVSARRAERLHELVGASAQALVLPCDAADPEAMAAAANAIGAAWGGIDSALYVAGDYLPMRAWAIDLTAAERMIAANLSGAVAFAAVVVPCLLDGTGQGGDIAFVASVAGYRGLPKALIYGPTKAALINFAETMAIDLQPRGVGVRIINPGFVSTPLTARNDFSMPALQSPEQAATAIVAGYGSSAFEIHFPKRFTSLMKLLALLPACLYLPLVRRLTR